MLNNTLTDVPQFRVGQMTDLDGVTGCTVIICPPGTVGAVDVRGGAPGTRETDLLRPYNHVHEVNAIVLSGGSAYGLASAQGVVEYLEETGQGYVSGRGMIVPIVPAAILFDLAVGDQTVRPTPQMGYQAAQIASTDPVAQGTVGAGTGAICGGFRGKAFATKGGIGSATVDLGEGLLVSALVAVNAVGDVLDEQGAILAGVRGDDGAFLGMMNLLRAVAHSNDMGRSSRENTVIGTIATNAQLDKAEATKVAQMAHDGIARAISPAHTMFDGDTIFTLASGEIESNPTIIGAFAADVMAQAIRNGIRAATSIDGVRAYNE